MVALSPRARAAAVAPRAPSQSLGSRVLAFWCQLRASRPQFFPFLPFLPRRLLSQIDKTHHIAIKHDKKKAKVGGRRARASPYARMLLAAAGVCVFGAAERTPRVCQLRCYASHPAVPGVFWAAWATL